jgi:hypothetical protein
VVGGVGHIEQHFGFDPVDACGQLAVDAHLVGQHEIHRCPHDPAVGGLVVHEQERVPAGRDDLA